MMLSVWLKLTCAYWMNPTKKHTIVAYEDEWRHNYSRSSQTRLHEERRIITSASFNHMQLHYPCSFCCMSIHHAYYDMLDIYKSGRVILLAVIKS